MTTRSASEIVRVIGQAVPDRGIHELGDTYVRFRGLEAKRAMQPGLEVDRGAFGGWQGLNVAVQCPNVTALSNARHWDGVFDLIDSERGRMKLTILAPVGPRH